MSGGLTADLRSVAPAGRVDWFAGSTPPAGWLACNGGTVSRTLYAALFAAIGVTYGAGDGATTFTLPDLRDDFIRGASGSRAVGSRASDTTRSHSHGYQDNMNKVIGTPYPDGYGGSTWLSNEGPRFVNEAKATDATGGGETAPRHVVMLPCIKW